MVLRALFRYLVNNEYLIEQLANSYPIRRAAQLTAYIFMKGKYLGEESMEKLKNSDTLYHIEDKLKHTGRKVSSFGTSFSEELKKGLKQMNEEIQRRQKR
ncbi:protein NCBP2AS2 homolog [Tachypleus tridentatus]|uniref:protein NCBP2AS2 homolog n=1 Tax=Tachypleus tridentatus TaxID=6853 RepID=UPI003FD2F967